MQSKITIFGAAAVVALGIGVANAADKTAPGGTGVEQSTEGQGATNKDTTTNTPTGAASGSATGMQPGTGVEDSIKGEGATNKQGVNETNRAMVRPTWAAHPPAMQLAELASRPVHKAKGRKTKPAISQISRGAGDNPTPRSIRRAGNV